MYEVFPLEEEGEEIIVVGEIVERRVEAGRWEGHRGKHGAGAGWDEIAVLDDNAVENDDAGRIGQQRMNRVVGGSSVEVGKAWLRAAGTGKDLVRGVH